MKRKRIFKSVIIFALSPVGWFIGWVLEKMLNSITTKISENMSEVLVLIKEIFLWFAPFLFILGILSVGILWLFWKYKDYKVLLREKTELINHLLVRQKYYNIMLTKFWDKNPSNSCNVFNDDLNLFTDKERIYLDEYMKDLEKLKIIMRGKNKVLGQFI